MDVAEDEAELTFPEVPEGYEERKCFVNIHTKEVWFAAWDTRGEVYYYKEGGLDTCWTLPEARDRRRMIDVVPEEDNSAMHVLDVPVTLRRKAPGVPGSPDKNRRRSYSADEILKGIQKRLAQFFNQRPPREDLISKGILQPPAVFGSTLVAQADRNNSTVPEFVTRCIAAIEAREGALETEGLYRHPG